MIDWSPSSTQLIGIMLNWFLYGILVMQVYVYYQCFPTDSRKIKALGKASFDQGHPISFAKLSVSVYGTFFLDTIQSVLATADAFHWFAKGYGNLIMLSDPFISAFDAPMLDGIIAFVAQTFFCWRMWVLQRSWWLPFSVFFIAIASLSGAIASGIGTFQANTLAHLDTLKWQLSLWLAGSALTDTLIAVIMTVLLLRSRTREFEQTDNILVRIVRMTVETNTATASVAIVVLVCLFALPHNPSIAMAPAYALGKLYSNTLLAVFNNRIYMSSKGVFLRSRALSTSEIEVKLCQPSSESSQVQMTEAQQENQREPYRIKVVRETKITKEDPFTTSANEASTSGRVSYQEP
ncbi:hypothetical protein J132_10386 [Termitomyces sp. J132]|nr:hypothetical protein J132_10386 [Termitomyces sp. J132]